MEDKESDETFFTPGVIAEKTGLKMIPEDSNTVKPQEVKPHVVINRKKTTPETPSEGSFKKW
jgi:hypothetical protein